MRRMLALFVSCAAVLPLMPSLGAAQDATEQVYMESAAPATANVPLVVIRFNQDKVLFERQLYNAIAKAVEIKPNVVLDVVSFVPVTGKESVDERLTASSAKETAGVVSSLRRMGIPSERMHVSNENAAELRFHEVHVYVE